MKEKTQAYDFPLNLFYDREHHMWARYDPANGNIVVGMDVLGLASLGDLAYVSLREVGSKVVRHESLGTLEAAKMTGDVMAPVSGVIVARNEEAMMNPVLINESPYNEGWLVVIKPEDWEREKELLVYGVEIPIWAEAEIKRYRSQGWLE